MEEFLKNGKDPFPEGNMVHIPLVYSVSFIKYTANRR